MFCAYGVLMPGFLLYDDACHLKSRMMSLMGSYWESAAGMCIAILIDKFHFSNHVNPWCVGTLCGMARERAAFDRFVRLVRLFQVTHPSINPHRCSLAIQVQGS